MNGRIGQNVDWGTIKARVEQARAVIETAFNTDADKAVDLLRERARHLAARRAPSAATRKVRTLIFRLGGARFALDLAALSGVGAWQNPEPVPGTNRALLGLLSARGAIWAVFDLAAAAVADGQSHGDGGQILFLRHAARNTALRVDEVEGLRAMDLSSAVAAPGGTSNPRDLSTGIMPDGVIVIDPERLATHPMYSEVFTS